MQTPLQITFHGIDPSDALSSAIRERVAGLEKLYDRMTGCHVVVEIPGRHQHQGKQFVVRIDMTVPGSELVVTKQHHEDVYVALRDAFDAARRRLEDHVRAKRDHHPLS